MRAKTTVRALLIATSVLTGVSFIAVPLAQAQSLDEMKAELRAMQKRIDQLEAQQKQMARAQRGKPAVVAAPAESAGQVRAAQRAAEDAQRAAAEAQQSAVQARQDAVQAKDTAAAEVKAAWAPPAGKPPNSFRIPGTDTVVRIYGYAKLNGAWDLTTQDTNEVLTAQSIQLFGTAAQRQGGDFQLTAKRSRFDLETWTPVNDTFGELHSLLEIDFAGQNTSLTTQATSNSYTPRLRKFYVDFGKANGGFGTVLFGQDNSTFNDQGLLPIQWMSDWDYVGISNVRQGLACYSYGFGNGISASFAVEQGYSDITTSSGTSYPNQDGGAGIGFQNYPDFTGRVMWKGPEGLLALRGVLRPQIDLNNQGSSTLAQRFNKSTTGYGVGATGVVNLADGRMVLMASANGGVGIGRYLSTTSNGFGAVSDAGLPTSLPGDPSINAIPVYGGMVGGQFFFTPTLRTNMSIGGSRLINPSYTSQFGGCLAAVATSGTCNIVNTSTWASAINLVWSPFKAIDVGLEWQHVERTLQAPFVVGPNKATTGGGIENRIQVTGIGRF